MTTPKFDNELGEGVRVVIHCTPPMTPEEQRAPTLRPPPPPKREDAWDEPEGEE